MTLRTLVSALCSCLCLLAQAVAPIWSEDFERASSEVPPDALAQIVGHGRVVYVSVNPNTPGVGRTVALPLPVEKLRGKRLFLSAEVRTSNVSPKPNPWNGVKVMMIIETPSGRSYPQPEIPEGSIEWRRFSISLVVPPAATNLLLVLGLEQVTGEAWFDNVRITSRSGLGSTLQPDPARPVFRGHSQPRLRGAMAGTGLHEDDVKHFAEVWKGNLLRLQIFEAARQDRTLDEYDAWLAERLRHIDQMLVWCEKHGVTAVLDLHSPPGGQAFAAGYVTARGRIFTQPQAQAKFVEVWQKMAARYQGRRVIWGFDLVNEPDDSMVTEECLDWNQLADKTARAIRAIDPERTLIIEPNEWGGAQGFAGFEPLALTGVVYSFHFYEPTRFTHQGIHGNPTGIIYPGLIGEEHWDRNALERAMQPAIEFARKYRVHVYVGEFSAIRTAPGDSAATYLADVIGIFERHGFDWSYHAYREWQGWSLEHEGPLDKPVRTPMPGNRQKVVTGWFAKNVRRASS